MSEKYHLEMRLNPVGCADIFAGIIDVGVIYSPEEARRIIACFNACAGIPLDWLESGTAGCLHNVREERDRYKRRSEDLAASLDEYAKLLELVTKSPTSPIIEDRQTVLRARSLVLKSTGSQS